MGPHFNRPDRDKLCRLLDKNELTAEETILRLSWQAGLLRNEITDLKWEQVSFENGCICCSDREISLSPELTHFLQSLFAKIRAASDFVVISERYQKPMQPQAISRIVRLAMDRTGQHEVRLVDLR